MQEAIYKESAFSTFGINKSPILDPVRKPNKLKHRPFFCDLCPKGFTQKGNLKRHLYNIHGKKKPHPKRESFPSGSDKSDSSQGVVPVKKEQLYPCDVCTKVFNKRSLLKEHYLVHAEEISHPCDLCERSFTTQRDLQEHINLVHVDKSHSCEDCSQTFKSSSELEKHQLIHIEEKSFMCDVCFKCFSKQGHLEDHYVIHDKEPLECHLCLKTFEHEGYLRRHYLLLHPKERILPFE